MKLAADNKIKMISFPSISTGAYGFPINRAAAIAVRTVLECLDKLKTIGRVIFICFSENDYAVYQRELAELSES